MKGLHHQGAKIEGLEYSSLCANIEGLEYSSLCAKIEGLEYSSLCAKIEGLEYSSLCDKGLIPLESGLISMSLEVFKQLKNSAKCVTRNFLTCLIQRRKRLFEC